MEDTESTDLKNKPLAEVIEILRDKLQDEYRSGLDSPNADVQEES